MFVELHILQNFPPHCLNRDDTNAPKDCNFGGYRRARISSQCIKRAVREYFQSHQENLTLSGDLATRSKLFLSEMTRRLTEKGKEPEVARRFVRNAIEEIGICMADEERTSVLLFLGNKELEHLADAFANNWDELHEAFPEDDSGSGELPDAIDEAFDDLKEGTSAADIALFGRMVAELTEMNVDAACQVAHAISTNQVNMEMDFYTAVDELQDPGKETGAGMMGFQEFNSSCFYRYSLLDVEQLRENLEGDNDLSRRAARAYVEGSVKAIPTGKQTWTAAQNPPSYIRLMVHNNQPCSLANAFLEPARPDKRNEKDLALVSIEKLEERKEAIDGIYGHNGDEGMDERSSTYDGYNDIPFPDMLDKLEEMLR